MEKIGVPAFDSATPPEFAHPCTGGCVGVDQASRREGEQCRDADDGPAGVCQAWPSCELEA
jgi:hypothetical protein